MAEHKNLRFAKVFRECVELGRWRWWYKNNPTDATMLFEEVTETVRSLDGHSLVMDASWSCKDAAGLYVPADFRFVIQSSTRGPLPGPGGGRAGDLTSVLEVPVFVGATGAAGDTPEDVGRYVQGKTFPEDGTGMRLFLRAEIPAASAVGLGMRIYRVPDTILAELAMEGR